MNLEVYRVKLRQTGKLPEEIQIKEVVQRLLVEKEADSGKGIVFFIPEKQIMSKTWYLAPLFRFTSVLAKFLLTVRSSRHFISPFQAILSLM